jgi:hypothetical protein
MAEADFLFPRISPLLPIHRQFIRLKCLTPLLSSPILFTMTRFIQAESAPIREIRGRFFLSFASFCSLIRVDQCSSVVGSRELYTTAQEFEDFAPMCTSVRSRAPSCGETKKFKMVHKPHIPAHPNQLHQLAPTCINLHQLAVLAVKKIYGKPQLAL